MASALLKPAVAFVTGTGVGAVLTAATTGNAQQRQPPPRQQPAPRVQNAPSVPANGPPRKSNKTLQAEAAAQKAQAEAEAKARDSEARAAEANAAARKAEADSEARKSEAASKAREAEEARKAKEAADAAAREREKDQSGYLSTGLAIATGALALVAGVRGGAVLARKAGEAASGTVKAINALGKEAATLNKASRLVAGTVKGDKMKAIVSEADALGRTTNFAGLGRPDAGEKLAKGLKVAGVAEVAASYAIPAAAPALGMSQESADRAAMLLRVTGAGALAGGYGLKAGFAATKTVRPSSRAIASINAGANRLAREGAGGAAQVSRNKVGATVARSAGELKAAKAGARVTASRAERQAVDAAATTKRARVRADKSVRAAKAGKVKTYKRTYRSGRKAGITETVTLN